MTIVPIREAKTQLARLLRQVIARIEMVIAKAGAWLGPMASRRPGLATGRLTEAFFEPLPADELATWQQGDK